MSDFELPLSFNPLEHQIRDLGLYSLSFTGKQISFIPGDDTHLLRWSHRGLPDEAEQRDLASAEEAQQVIDTLEQHLTALADVGITTPAHRHKIGPSPNIEGQVAIYTKVERIPAENPRYQRVPRQALGKALLGYVDWIADTEQPYWLYDIFSPHQYRSYGEYALHLLDIGPDFARRGTTERNGRLVLDYKRGNAAFMLR